MPRKPYYQRKSPAPPSAPDGPTTETLLAQADALTRLARTSWLTTILGSLYVWVAIAALRDIQLFLPDETMTLPILNIGISPGGFFFFAPLLLLAVFTHLHLTLIRLWRVYRDLDAPDGTVDGLPVLDRVSPWMLNHVMSRQKRGFEWLAKGSAYFFGWFFAPITIIALSYRYLRTHDPLMTDYHAIISALAITLATGFWLEKKQALSSFTNTANWAIAAIATVALALGLSRGANALIDARINFPSGFAFLTTNAQLYRAELSTKPESWNAVDFARLGRQIAVLEGCESASDGPDCASPTSETLSEELATLYAARSDFLIDAKPAQLGHVASSDNDWRPFQDEYCDSAVVLSKARDLVGADLRQTFIARGNLVCTDLTRTDLRGARLYGADLRRADLPFATLEGAHLDGADLSYANLRHAALPFARLPNAILDGANLQGAILFTANLIGANLSEARLEGAYLVSADLRRADMIAARSAEANLRMARLDDAELLDARFENADLMRAHLSGANLATSNLEGASLVETRLVGARLANTILRNADLSGADLANALLDAVQLRASNVRAVKLKGAAIRSMDLSKIPNLTLSSLETAFGDGSVALPEGWRRPVHWPSEMLDNDAFFGRWRWWRESEGLPWPPPGKALEWLARFEAVAPPDSAN